MTIFEKAEKYAEGKVDQAINKTIVQAYIKGYKNGYKDREQEIPIDLLDNQTEYIDLGLPSGTLWAKNFEKESEEYVYLPYEKAQHLNIPSLEQWRELSSSCKFVTETNQTKGLCTVYCVGPNGTMIIFYNTGYIIKDIENNDNVYFWITSGNKVGQMTLGENIKISVKMTNSYPPNWDFLFSGYKLPIRLVK